MNTSGANTARGISHAYDDTPLPPEPPDGEGNNATNAHPVLADFVLTRADLRNMPEPQPLITNTLDQGTTALLFGKWGTAKSFIALDWAASVATGRRWQGRDTEQQRVLYVAAEGAFGLRARVDAWESGWQTTIHDDTLSILPRPINLTKNVDLLNLEAFIDWGGYQFVILDTLARCMVGAEENSAKDTGIVIDAMTRLLARTPNGRGVILGVHHAGKDGKTLRGSSAFESGVDTVYSTSRDGETITLDRTKRKDGPEPDRHLLRLDPIPGTGSCALSTSHETVRRLDHADELLSHITSHFAGVAVSPSQLCATTEMSRATIYRTLSELVKRGDIRNVGTTTRAQYITTT